MLKCPDIPRETKRLLTSIRNRGVTPTDEEIIWLYALGKEVESPSAEKWHFTESKTVNGITFHLPTVASELWIEEIANPNLSGSWLAGISRLYALAFAKRPRHLESLNSETIIRQTLRKWFRKLPLNEREIMDVMQWAYELSGKDEPSEQTETKTVFDDYALQLVEHFGESHQYWFEVAPIKRIERCLAAIARKHESESKQRQVSETDQKSRDALKSILIATKRILKSHGK